MFFTQSKYWYEAIIEANIKYNSLKDKLRAKNKTDTSKKSSYIV